jgi:hypothetical protein
MPRLSLVSDPDACAAANASDVTADTCADAAAADTDMRVDVDSFLWLVRLIRFGVPAAAVALGIAVRAAAIS